MCDIAAGVVNGVASSSTFTKFDVFGLDSFSLTSALLLPVMN